MKITLKDLSDQKNEISIESGTTRGRIVLDAGSTQYPLDAQIFGDAIGMCGRNPEIEEE